VLRVQDIHSIRGETRILHGITLHVDKGEIVAILGRNGMGKTTLLRSIIGLSKVTQGAIVLDGVDVTHAATYAIVRRGIGVVLEDRGMFASLTVEENLRMGLHEQIRKGSNLSQIYEGFPALRARRSDQVASLSGGQQQLLAIARALISRPRLLLIDEFSEGIQPNLVREISNILQRLNAEGVSILIVEQNARLALGISHRAYILEKGRVVASGSSQSLLSDEVLRRHLVV
jgi:branched-chain amino acid transport system ATP-binding protein